MPVFIENESAYEAAIARRIRQNAEKGYHARFGEEANIVLAAIASNRHKEGFWSSLANAVSQYGRPTEKQHAAVLRILADMESKREEYRQRDAAVSQHVGTVGQRCDFSATVSFVTQFHGSFGPQYVTGFRDETGNILIAKTSKPLNVSRGTSVKFSAFVKGHGEREGVKQTMINRIKL
jgi:hypothetical protein